MAYAERRGNLWRARWRARGHAGIQTQIPDAQGSRELRP